MIDKAEFMILCMVRTGSASPALIKMIGEYYNELDLDHDGSLTMDEICQRVSYQSDWSKSVYALGHL